MVVSQKDGKNFSELRVWNIDTGRVVQTLQVGSDRRISNYKCGPGILIATSYIIKV